MTGKWRKALRKIWQEPEEGAEEEKTMSVDLKKKFRGCLLAGAAGDALGYAVEFMHEPDIDEKYGKGGITRYELDHGEAIISDDTQMTMFTANGLLCGEAEDGTEDSCYQGIALCYLDWLKTQTGSEYVPTKGAVSWLNTIPQMNSRRAPGGTCLSSLYEGGFGTVKNPINQRMGCGGVMRVAPIGLFFEDEDLCCRLGAEAAAVTHGHEMGYLPAAALSCIVNRAVYGGNMTLEQAVISAEKALERNFPEAVYLSELLMLMKRARDLAKMDMDDRSAIHLLGAGWVGHEALVIAIYCALKHPCDLEKCLIAAVNHDGDSDSTGAIAGNILGAYLGEDCIGQHYLNNLELRDTIGELAEDLYSAVCARGGQESAEWKRKYC